MIVAEGLGRTFGGRPVVSDLSFCVESGEVVGLVGPNGAGKTTTIRMLLGVLRPSTGQATTGKPVGYMPEVFSGYDALTVRGYLRFCARMKDYGRDVAEEAVERTGLVGLARRPMSRLSKGQRQRVGLAQATMGAPMSLILDEPTIGLDPRQVVDARSLITSIADAGAAVLLSTHLLAEAASICDRVLIVTNGNLVAEETDLSAEDLETRVLEHMTRAELR